MKTLSLLLFFLISTIDFKSCKKKEYVVWSSSRKLKWSDFQMEKINSYDVSALASVKIKFDYTIKDSLEYDVSCLFYKKESWTSIATLYGLNHEQRHFDIGEIVGREFRKKVEENRKSITQRDFKKLDSIFIYFQERHAIVQKEYDSATKNGGNRLEQDLWNHEIDRQLDSLSKYERKKD